MTLPGIPIPQKPLSLHQLAAEMRAAGLNVPMLGTNTAEGKLFTYDAQGVPIDLPNGYQAVIDAHVPVAAVDFGSDVIDIGDIEIVRAYVNASKTFLANATPSNAQVLAQVQRNTKAILTLIRRIG